MTPNGKSCRHPAALLKVYRPLFRHSGSRNNNIDNDDDNCDNSYGRVGEKEGGRSTDVLFLDNLADIEEALLKAGCCEGEERLSISAAEEQRKLLQPRRMDVQKTEKENEVAPDTGTLGDRSVPTCSINTERALQFPRPSVLGGKAEVVRRTRPWAIQKFLTPKGPLAWYVEKMRVLSVRDGGFDFERAWLGLMKHFATISLFRKRALRTSDAWRRPICCSTLPRQCRFGGEIAAQMTPLCNK